MAKQTAIATIDESHDVPRGSELEHAEHDLAQAMVNEFEAFYQQGLILDRIRRDKLFKDANYTSFDKYMDARQPLGIKRTHAWRLIAAMQIRPLLPQLPDSPVGESVWSERCVRPLTHSDFTPADVKRIGKKIATQVKRGTPLSDSLVKSICDEDRGVAKKKFKKKSANIAATKTAAQTIESMTIEVNLWLGSLGKVPGEFWSEAEEDEPGCVKDLIAALSEFVKFLRS